MARDRNHDRIPDRWERAHHLSLRVNQARRDQDRDGLNNRGEFRARLDPRDADTDDDGIEDGAEHPGTIKSFTGGVLTISLAGGGTLSGRVTDATEIECPGAEESSDEGRDDDQGDDNDNQGDDNDDQGDDDQGDDDDDADEHDCGTAALTTGRTVREAELSGSGASATFREVELGS
jgi:hypothetical protein